MQTIATINFKGGVGKTTLTWCLGDRLAGREGKRVLVFDLDAQTSMTQAVALGPDGKPSEEFAEWRARSLERERTIFSVLLEHVGDGLQKFEPDDDFVYRLKENYDFVPSTPDLYWLEMENLDSEKGKFFIKNLLGRIENSGRLPDYDYVLFDCPPSFTMLSYSILTCCDLILIPFNADFFAAEGIHTLVEGLHHRIRPHPLPKVCVFANRVRTWRNPTRNAGIWMNDVKETCEELEAGIGREVRYLNAWIPDRAALRDAIVKRATPKALDEPFRTLWQDVKKAL